MYYVWFLFMGSGFFCLLHILRETATLSQITMPVKSHTDKNTGLQKLALQRGNMQ